MTIQCHMPTCSFTQNFWGKTFLERTTVHDCSQDLLYAQATFVLQTALFALIYDLCTLLL